jgi:hypothetical protein
MWGGGGEGMAPQHGMEVSGHLNAPAAVPPLNNDLCYPLYGRVGGPRSRSGPYAEGKTTLVFIINEFSSCAADILSLMK